MMIYTLGDTNDKMTTSVCVVNKLITRTVHLQNVAEELKQHIYPIKLSWQQAIEARNAILDTQEKICNKMKEINKTKTIENYRVVHGPHKT